MSYLKVLVLLCLLWPSDCLAENLDGFYVKLAGGVGQYTPLEGHPAYDPSKSNKMCPVVEGGFGYKINDYVRADAVVHFSRLKYKTNTRFSLLEQSGLRIVNQKIKTTAIFANVYLSPKLSSEFATPFIVFGFGGGSNQSSKLDQLLKSPDTESIESIFKTKNTHNLMWAIGAGVLLEGSSRDYSIELSYKYLNLGSIKVSRLSNRRATDVLRYVSAKLAVHQVLFGFNMHL